MIRILPDRLGHDERRVGRNLAEDFDAILLAVDEAVFLSRVVRMPALDPIALLLDHGGERLFKIHLLFFAGLVGGQA